MSKNHGLGGYFNDFFSNKRISEELGALLYFLSHTKPDLKNHVNP